MPRNPPPPPPPLPPRSPFGAAYRPPRLEEGRPPDNRPPRILGELELEGEPGTLAVHDQAFIFAPPGTPIVAPPRPVAAAAASQRSPFAAALRNRNTIDSPPPARDSVLQRSPVGDTNPHSNNNNESASPSDGNSSKVASPVQSPEQGKGGTEEGDRDEPMEDVSAKVSNNVQKESKPMLPWQQAKEIRHRDSVFWGIYTQPRRHALDEPGYLMIRTLTEIPWKYRVVTEMAFDWFRGEYIVRSLAGKKVTKDAFVKQMQKKYYIKNEVTEEFWEEKPTRPFPPFAPFPGTPPKEPHRHLFAPELPYERSLQRFLPPPGRVHNHVQRSPVLPPPSIQRNRRHPHHQNGQKPPPAAQGLGSNIRKPPPATRGNFGTGRTYHPQQHVPHGSGYQTYHHQQHVSHGSGYPPQASPAAGFGNPAAGHPSYMQQQQQQQHPALPAAGGFGSFQQPGENQPYSHHDPPPLGSPGIDNFGVYPSYHNQQQQQQHPASPAAGGFGNSGVEQPLIMRGVGSFQQHGHSPYNHYGQPPPPGSPGFANFGAGYPTYLQQHTVPSSSPGSPGFPNLAAWQPFQSSSSQFGMATQPRHEGQYPATAGATIIKNCNFHYGKQSGRVKNHIHYGKQSEEDSSEEESSESKPTSKKRRTATVPADPRADAASPSWQQK